MKAILRSAIVAAGAASTMIAGMTPASAAPGGAVAFTGTANISCFGCPGTPSGTASLTGVGVTLDAQVVNGSATANYTVTEPTDETCVVTGTANGSVTGAIDVSFNWIRVGATAVITTTGDVNGAGVAVFVVTSPVGNPCGGAVTATVAGAVAGT